MNRMFAGATSFNQNISSWPVGNVKDMERLFGSTTSFEQDLSQFDVSKFSTQFDSSHLFLAVLLCMSMRKSVVWSLEFQWESVNLGHITGYFNDADV